MSTNSDEISAVPLCGSMLKFRDAFVGFCDHPTAETKQQLADTLHEVEVEAHDLHEKVVAH